MTAKRWSFATRVTCWFVLTNLAVFLLLTAVGQWLVAREIAVEREDPAERQFAGTRALFHELDQSPDEFSKTMEVFADYDLTPPIGIRIWNRDTGQTLASFFPDEFRGETWITTTAIGETHRIDEELRWCVGELDESTAMGLLLPGYDDALAVALDLDPHAQVEFIERYQDYTLWFAAFAASVSALVGMFLGRRMSQTLREVAASVNASDEHAEVQASAAPNEVCEVVDAMNARLAAIRDADQHSKLVTAGVAHELSAPLQNMLSETELALMRERSPSEYRVTLSSMLEEIHTLGRALDNLVGLVGQAAVGARYEEFDLGSEMNLKLDVERNSAALRGVELKLETEGNLRMRGDREGLVLAVRNLIDNAIKWSPKGTTVVATFAASTSEVRITVDDAGPGVPEDLRAAVFEPFRQGVAVAGQRAGYGMGLALAHQAVEAQGGRIEVADSPSGGARFVVVLPNREATNA